MSGAGGLGRHDKASAALFAQVAPEVGNPEVVAVADLLLAESATVELLEIIPSNARKIGSAASADNFTRCEAAKIKS
jgi:hypothetical protein